MNPIVMALLGRQAGMQQPGMGGGMPQMRAPDTLPGPGGVGTAENPPPPPPLTLDAINQMKLNGRGLPNDWLNKISPMERASIMPQWSNG